jgi:hypothetical protein
MDKEEERKRKDDAILKELQLLEKMRKEHEWAVFRQKEAEEVERIEAELDSEASTEHDEPE